MDKILTHTDMVTNDKYFRLENKIKGRLEYFTHQIKKIFPGDEGFPPKINQKLNEISTHFNEMLSCLGSVGFKYNNYQVLGDIRKADEEYLEIYRDVAKWPTREEHFENEFFALQEILYFDSDISAHCMREMSESAKAGCLARIKDRIWIQINDAVEKGWFIAFQTLTVRGECYEHIFETKSDAWRNYIRSIKRMVQANKWGSVRKARLEDECFHFIGIVEPGGENERLHLHTLLFMDLKNTRQPFRMPFGDPNRGNAKKDQREIREFIKYWPYGYSMTIPCRFNQADAYASAGWVWPLENGVPIPQSGIEKLAAYMTKYITKMQRIDITRRDKTWKIRADHKMGKMPILNKIKKMETETLTGLIPFKQYPTIIQMYGKRINNKLIRTIAVKEFLNRKQNASRYDLSSEKSTAILELLKNTNQGKCSRNWQNIGDILDRVYQNADISKKYTKAFYKAKQEIEA